MPGLTAILTPKYDKSFEKDISIMTESMCYENFYKKEIFNQEPIPFFAGRVHLNTKNNDPQPIYNESNTIFILMDGEIRGADGLKERLKQSGHKIRTNSEAELLLHLYEDMQDDFVHELNGWFFAFLHDIKQKKTLIVNDCFGICRVFYTEQDNNLIVSSEIKSILKFQKASFNPNTDKIPEYFLYDSILNNETLFKDIYRLPPASLWIYQHGTTLKKQYFDFSTFKTEITMSKSEFDDEANRVFRKIMPNYAGTKDVGLSLTGGMDSRATLATIKSLGYSTPCYTWCGPYGDNNDVRSARKVAKIADVDYQVFRIGKDFFENFSDYAEKTVFVSDGSTDIFRSHEIYLNNLVRTNAPPIRLTGKFGSHIMTRGLLAKNVNNPFICCHNIFSKKMIDDMGSLKKYIYKPEKGTRWILDAIRWLWPDGFMAIERTQLFTRCAFIDKELATLLLKTPESYLQNRSVQSYIIKNNYPLFTKVITNRADYIKTDSLFQNTRLKVLALVSKPFFLMDRAYVNPGVPDIFLRLDPFMRVTGLEKFFLGTDCLVGYRRWVKDELKEYMIKLLKDERTLSRSYLNADFIKQMSLEHFSNKANYTREIGKILSLELWHRLFVD